MIQLLRYKSKWLLSKFFQVALKKQKIRNLIRDSGYFVDQAKLCEILNLFSQNSGLVNANISKSAVNSKSQNSQDLMVLRLLNFRKGGFFVEFGATDGIELSNTFLLEKDFSWTGILSEPARIWHKRLASNRTAFIDFRCVSSVSGNFIKFSQAKSYATHSGILDFLSDDFRSGKEYDVESISLEDLLVEYSAPTVIDYLSIDTEGSELEIMKNFDFSKYKFRIITIEHNFRRDAFKILELLLQNGYVQILEKLSGVEYWFMHEDLISQIDKEFST